jgi:FtsP/CotA-like multicopper oxidase with cupredoxin domain
MKRREFIQISGMAGAGLLVGGRGTAYAFAQSQNLRKFIQKLRLAGADIPLAASDGTRRWPNLTATHYTIDISEFRDQLHPDLANPTTLWGYGQGGVRRHLGGIIAAKKGTPVQITFRNKLTSGRHIIPVDTSIPGADLGPERTAVHLHGGLVPWTSDGGPFAWWDANGGRGESFLNNDVLNPRAGRNAAEYYYPNNQSARLVWYHDHAIGITRINAYAGIASAYVIYDDYETITLAAAGLPGPLDARTHYLVFQDKIFVSPTITTVDPMWPVLRPDSVAGDLWYAHTYDPARWGELGPAPAGPPPDPSVIPEFFGDTILVNGTVYPFLEVEQRQYRFRVLNACNARFLNPRLVYAQGTSGASATEPSPALAGPSFVQFGTEGGFLPAPVLVNGSKQLPLLLAPAERADLVVDFRNVPAGSVLILYNDAPAPFPGGDARNDYSPTNPKTPASVPGFGPNTRTLLQIKVKARVGAADPPVTLPASLTAGIDPFLVTQTPGVPTPIPAGVNVRRLTLNEAFDEHGRLIQYLGTDAVTDLGGPGQFGRTYMEAPTEVIAKGTTEVWEIANLTGDTHPIHFHLVNVQVLSRQPISAPRTGGVLNLLGPAVAPAANELGWKETVRMNPGEVTRVIMRFDLPAVPFKVPLSPRTGGHEYVWHCHILEHEEHDMMRPLVVL